MTRAERRDLWGMVALDRVAFPGLRHGAIGRVIFTAGAMPAARPVGEQTVVLLRGED